MGNIKTFTARSGSLTIDFDNQTISYMRDGVLSDTLKLYDMKFKISEITAIEERQPTLLKLGNFNIIVNNIRYITSGGFDATQFSPTSKSDFYDLEGAMKQVLRMANLSGFSGEGSVNAKKEIFTPGKEQGVEFILDSGSGSTLKVYKDHIVLNHGGILNMLSKNGMKGEKRINYNSITAIELKRASSHTVGYISFSLFGSDRQGGVNSAASDENSIIFNSSSNELAIKIVDYIEEKRSALSNPSQIIQQTSVADELLKFKQLLDMGIITEEEFNNKKKNLLK